MASALWLGSKGVRVTCRCVIAAVPLSGRTLRNRPGLLHFLPPPPALSSPSSNLSHWTTATTSQWSCSSSHVLLYAGSRGMVSQTNHNMSLSCFRALRIKSKVYDKIYTTLPGLSLGPSPSALISHHSFLVSLYSRAPDFQVLISVALVWATVLSSALQCSFLHSSSLSLPTITHTLTCTHMPLAWVTHLQALVATWHPLGGVVCPPSATPPPTIASFLGPWTSSFVTVITYIYLFKSLP